MPNILILMASLALILHGLIHLMGTASYLKLAEVQGLPYKTTILGGRWDWGESGNIINFYAIANPPSHMDG